MSTARDAILARVRGALGRGPLSEQAQAALDQRLTAPRANVVPARGRAAPADRLELFAAEAERVDATTVRLPTLDAVPGAIVGFLRAANMPAAVRIGDDPALHAVPWQAEPLLHVDRGRAEDADTASVSVAFTGVAETGTLVLLSGPDNPTTLNFLPELHMVVLASDRIVGCYEEAMQRLRDRLGAGRMPRVVNWITGPSRTADIEQTLLLGAHGPKRLHILLVDGEIPG